MACARVSSRAFAIMSLNISTTACTNSGPMPCEALEKASMIWVMMPCKMSLITLLAEDNFAGFGDSDSDPCCYGFWWQGTGWNLNATHNSLPSSSVSLEKADISAVFLEASSTPASLRAFTSFLWCPRRFWRASEAPDPFFCSPPKFFHSDIEVFVAPLLAFISKMLWTLLKPLAENTLVCFPMSSGSLLQSRFHGTSRSWGSWSDNVPLVMSMSLLPPLFSCLVCTSWLRSRSLLQSRSTRHFKELRSLKGQCALCFVNIVAVQIGYILRQANQLMGSKTQFVCWINGDLNHKVCIL